MIEFWNFTLKIKFRDKNWVRKIPFMLKLAKTSQIRGIPGFQDVWILGLRNPEMIPKVHIIIPLSWIYTKCVKFSKLLAISREISGSQIIPGRFQGWWNFLILQKKSCSRPNNEWEKYPIHWYGQKIGHFQVISRVPENFWKFQEWWNFEILCWKSSFLT